MGKTELRVGLTLCDTILHQSTLKLLNYIHRQTDRQTDRHDYNNLTPSPFGGGDKGNIYLFTHLFIYLFIYLLGFYQHCIGHITMGSFFFFFFFSRGNQYIQLVELLYCKLPTIAK